MCVWGGGGGGGGVPLVRAYGCDNIHAQMYRLANQS